MYSRLYAQWPELSITDTTYFARVLPSRVTIAVAVAYRESLEEAGCEIEELIVINEFYTTPGGAAERITLFCGKVDSTQIGGIHGLDDEDEDILVHCVNSEEAYQMVVNNDIESAIPIIAIQWLQLNKQQLQQKWAL